MMNENEINNYPSEGNPEPIEEMEEQVSDEEMEQTPPPSYLEDDEEPQDGLTFNWVNLLLGAGICFVLFHGSESFSDWKFYLFLAVVIIIHELGHVIMGKSFGCHIKEMQVFFLPFISYKPKQDTRGSSWQNIKWSLGALPLGGVTVFESRTSNEEEESDADTFEIEPGPSVSPYIEDKPAWQRMLVSAAGVLFNIATFLILYITLPYMSDGCYDIFRPIAVISLLLAFLNILPVYPLDGGAIVFALYEIITGNKPSQQFTQICAWIGFVFIILFFWVFPEWLNGILDSVFNAFF